LLTHALQRIGFLLYFLSLACYVPNVAKEISVRSMNIDDRRPTSHFG